ncbi:hypothetical protein, partial [Bacillus mycoides]|uniref:hypothetical protein n=1 Tax=Bacillus mycoides TaxID=1405 RepID=UPI0011AE3207
MCNGGQNAGQGFTANPIATNISAGGQCLPVISVVTPMTPLISQLVCNGGQNAGQGFTANPIATNIAAGGQCLPVISVVTPMTPLISQL